jgi:uncharacterized protein
MQLPPDFYRGVNLFNEQEFFECHEVLEDVWNEQPEPERQLTQGIIQIAVALYHAGRNNFVGAERLLNRGIPRVELSLPLDVNVDVADLLANALAALDAVSQQKQPTLFQIRVSDNQRG